MQKNQSKSFRRKTVGLLAGLLALGLAVVLACQYLSNFFYVYWTAFSVQQQGYDADVVFVGPSHVFTDVIPQKLYDDYGIAACNVAAGSVGMHSIYWAARESIDAMHPEVLCIDMMAMMDLDDPENVNLIEELPLLSPNRWLAMAEAGAGLDDWGEYVRFLFSHGQYEETDRENVDSANYQGIFSLFMGYEQSESLEELTAEDEPHVDPDDPYVSWELDAGNVDYYRRLAEYAEKKGVEVVWYISVDPRADRQEGYRNTEALLAADGRTLINCNYDEIKQQMGYDVTTDMRDSHHMNYSGAYKFTTWLGQYLSQQFELPDRRGQKGYELWQAHPYSYQYLHTASQLAACDDLDSYLALLHELCESEDYTLAITAWGEWSLTDAQRQLLSDDWNNGELLPENSVDFLFVSGEGKAQLSRADTALPDAIDAAPLLVNLDGRAFTLTDGEKGMSLTIDREEALPSINGFGLTVYSSLTHEVVDSVRFSPSEPVVHSQED